MTHRITVNLNPRAYMALRETETLTGDTKTEVVNKALQAYVLIQRLQSLELAVLMQAKEGEAPARVYFH